jgi:RsiW-degrading membrane proteinase PrsW (M82 family)
MHIEQVKLIHDHTKHLTTLSTGSIVLLVTFYEKLGNPPMWKPLISVALIGFVICILATTAAQIFTITYADPNVQESDDEKVNIVFFLTSWLSFSLAVISLCIFGVKNIGI